MTNIDYGGNPSTEIWRDITYPAISSIRYSISNKGNVRDKSTNTPILVERVPGDYPVITIGKLTIQIHKMVAWEFCITMLNKENPHECGIVHCNMDIDDYNAENLEYVPCEIKDAQAENAFFAATAKELEWNEPQICDRFGLSSKQYNKYFYAGTRYQDIIKLFVIKQKDPKPSLNPFSKIQHEEIKYLILLGLSAKEICGIYKIRYCMRTFRSIDMDYGRMLEEQESGVFPKDLDFNNGSWKYTIENHPVVKDAVIKYLKEKGEEIPF